MAQLHIPRLVLDLDGVDPALARQVAALLPGALERALGLAQGLAQEPGRAGSVPPPRPGSAQALADQAASRVLGRLQGHLSEQRAPAGRAAVPPSPPGGSRAMGEGQRGDPS